MTSNQVRGLAADATEEQAVAQYLQHNNDFFERHPQLLARLRLQHPRNGCDRLADRAAGRSAAREVPGAGAEAGRVRARGARQQRAGREDPSLHAPAAAHRRRAIRRIAEIEASLREDFDAFHAVLVLADAGRAADCLGAAFPAPRRPPRIRPTAASRACLRPASRAAGRSATRSANSCSAAKRPNIGSVALIPLGAQLPARPAGARQRRSRPLPPGHEHRISARMGELITDALGARLSRADGARRRRRGASRWR